MSIATKLAKTLHRNAARYDVLDHPRTYTSMETAQVCHVPGNRVAKSVLLNDGSRYLLAVVPASHRVDFEQMRRETGRPVWLASEQEAGGLFDDCALGAIPPVGPEYGVRTYVDDALLTQSDVYFEAGDHEELIHVSGETFDHLLSGAQHGRISYA